MLLFPDLTLLDFVGPYDLFVNASSFEIYTISADGGDVIADGGLTLKAQYDFTSCPDVDMLFVPGGGGVTPLLANDDYKRFLKAKAETAQYVTSVCTGALLLAAAGLLDGYRATTHWRSLELLALFPVEVSKERVVVDRNRITGGGVTAGIDFGLTVCALLAGENTAKLDQLYLQYDPQPPFHCGSPATADPDILEEALETTKAQYDQRKKIILEILGKK